MNRSKWMRRDGETAPSVFGGGAVDIQRGAVSAWGTSMTVSRLVQMVRALFVPDVDVPHVEASAFVVKGGGADDPTIADAAEVVGVDLDADGSLAEGGGDEMRTHGAEGLGQHHAGTTVQQAVAVGASGHRQGVGPRRDRASLRGSPNRWLR